ncbi:MAG TPA: EpsI family protein [Pyrinomonadaceae bacterium]|nr:EpsI family protein [Pyrinomonadaceae bacterium]
MKSWRFAILFVLLLAGGLVVNAWEYLGEAHVERKQLRDFPRQMGSWQQSGGDEQFNQETLAVLRASDYLLRNYRGVDGRLVNFYVGYYASQREGATYHSPLNCLPGSGWVMSEPGRITITPVGRPAFVATKYLIQNGDHKQLLVYWYQGRGRAVASEYWGKVYTVLDSVRMRRSDGAMVRITTSVDTADPAALQTAINQATDLAASSSTILPEFIPD